MPLLTEADKSVCSQYGIQVTQANQPKTKLNLISAKSGIFIHVSLQGCDVILLSGSQLHTADTRIVWPGPPVKRTAQPYTGSPPVPLHPQTATRQAMILGAGLGTRFEPLSGQITGLPKPGVPLLGDHSVIMQLARHLYRHGIRRLVVNTFYKASVIKAQLNRLSSELPDLDVLFVDEEAPSGTAGGLVKALAAGYVDTTQPILIMQGDAVTNADLSRLLNWHAAQSDVTATLGVRTVDDASVSKMAIVTTDASAAHPEALSGRVLTYQEKPTLEQAGNSRLGSIGFYVLSPHAYEGFSQCGQNRWQTAPDFDYAMHYFPWLLQTGQSLMACHLQEPFYWSDIGQPLDYLSTVKDIYAGCLTADLPANPLRFYENGVVYWSNGRETAEKAGIKVEGNAIVFTKSG